MANIYVSSVGYTAVTPWSAGLVATTSANGGRGTYIRQTSPALNAERVFRCTTAGTAGGTEPTWVLTKNATTTDGGIVWTECTGQEADQISGSWNAPHARLANATAATWSVAGDIYYLAHNHAETQATNLTVTFPGTSTVPNMVACVNSLGSMPPVSADLRTTATITTTTTASQTFDAYSNFYGVIFNIGSGTGVVTPLFGNNSGGYVFENCSIRVNATGSGCAIGFGNTLQNIVYGAVLINTTVSLGFINHIILIRNGNFVWKNTPNAILGTIPSLLINSSHAGTVLLEGVDISALASGTVFGTFGAKTATLKNCKIASNTVIHSGTNNFGLVSYVTNSDSGASNYRHEKYMGNGSQVTETTIVRTLGASDGTTPISWKITTTANATWRAPFESMPIVIWNDTTSTNVTLTLYGIWGGGAVPNNDDIWIEVGYPGSNLSPILTRDVTTTKANFLATNSPLTADSTSIWGGSTTRFKIVVTLSSPQPMMKGPIYVKVLAAKASSVFYIDPKIEKT